MPVADHPVHPSGVVGAEHRYGCWNRPPFKETITAESWKGSVSWPFRMSRECRYDKSLDDRFCAGCMHAGSGERYAKESHEKGAN